MIQDRLGVQLGPQLDLHIQLLQLALIPLVQLVQLFLKVVGPGGNEIAAQPVARLAEGDLVAPQRRTAGGLHPGHAAADHQDIFLDRSRRQAKAGFPRRLGIHRAPGSTADL